VINIFKKTLAALVLASTAGIAAAVPVTDIHDPTDLVLTYNGAVSEYTYVHNILDDLPFYVPGTDTIGSATLTIYLSDPDNEKNDKETFRFVISSDGTLQEVDGPFPGNGQNVPNGGIKDYSVILGTSLGDLQLDGLLSVTVKATLGSFAFSSSTLEAQVTKGDTGFTTPDAIDLPEPVSLGLFAIGLAGFAASRRRLQK